MRGLGSDVLDGEYWAERGGPRTATLLAASGAAVRAAELGVRERHAGTLVALTAGLEEAMETVQLVLSESDELKA